MTTKIDNKETKTMAHGAAHTPNTSIGRERKVYTGTAQRIMNYLSSGCNQIEAAKACAVDESLVSQLMAEEDFKSQVAEKLSVNFREASQIDENYQAIEKVASERLVKLLEHEFSPDRLMRMAKFANEAKRKVAPNIQNGNGNGTNGNSGPGAVVLVLPSFIVNGAERKELVVNPNNEIVAVGGRELTTFNSQGLDKLVAEKQKKQQNQTQPALPVKTNGSGKGSREKVDPYSDL